MYKLTIKEINKLDCDLKSKYSIYLNQRLEELLNHDKTYSEVWNAIKYCETSNDYEEQLKYVYHKALDNVENGSNNWKHTWMQVANDVMKIRIDLMDIKLDHVVSEGLSKAIDKVLKDLK